eukprot:2703063-Pyramimonas_sp.AAC.2
MSGARFGGTPSAPVPARRGGQFEGLAGATTACLPGCDQWRFRYAWRLKMEHPVSFWPPISDDHAPVLYDSEGT